MPDDTPRNAEEIARRTILLHCTVAAAHGVSKQDIAQWLQIEKLHAELTPREARFMAAAAPAQNEVTWMSWLAEAQFVLLWSIGKIGQMPLPISKCDTGLILKVMPGLFTTTNPFILSAKLRASGELEVEYERIYDIHCTVRGALRKGAQPPNGYDKDVVFFRHYALNWITGYCGQAWDEIRTDT